MSCKIVACFLVLICPAIKAHTALHHSEMSFLGVEVKRAGPTEVVKNIKDAVMPDKAKEEKKQEEKPTEEKEKTMANPIDIMRGQLCWARHSITGHNECMKWLVEECTTHSFGTGLCKKLRKHVKEECLKKNQKACDYAKQLGIDMTVDTDGDGTPDKDDAFPKDPKETKDTDGDGVGDNADEDPNDPKCTKNCKPPPAPAPAPAAPAPEKTPEKVPAPAPAKEEPKAAPAPAKEEPKAAPAPAKEEPKAAPAPAKAEEKAAPTGYQDPVAKEGLQSQGFSGKKVTHADGKTATGDWGNEYGGQKDEPKKSSGPRSWNMNAWKWLAIGAMAFAWSV